CRHQSPCQALPGPAEEALLPGPHHLHELWPVAAMVWEGPSVVYSSRAMLGLGHTDSAEAVPGTIRRDFSIHISKKLICASDSMEGAQRKIQPWFWGSELVD
ncbi:unnamed protein product, partial [Gulo gulo]